MNKILVQCVFDQRLRMRIVSDGYYKDLNCQCSRNIRIKNQMYEIDNSQIILNTSRGKWFYVFITDPIPIYDKSILDNLKIYESNEDNDCIICLDIQKNTILVPCGHYILCTTCSNKISICPLCRSNITYRIDSSNI